MTTVEEFINSKPHSLRFLEKHPQIMKLIYKRVHDRNKHSIQDFETCLDAYNRGNGGSFGWSNSEEGSFFWSELFSTENVNIFYDLYPKINKNRID